MAENTSISSDLSTWHPLTRQIILASAVAILPRVVEIPIWATLFCFLAWGWSLAGTLGHLPRPGRSLRRVVTLLPLAGVFASFSGVFNLSAGASYLAVLLSVKPMENESSRDVVVGLYLVLFFNVFNVFSSQDVFMGLHLFLSSGLTMAVLAISANPGLKLKEALKTTAGLALRGLPVMIILFIAFPRLPGGLVHFGKESARTGFNSILEMGAVGELAQDNSTAFRVEFLGQAPSHTELYWRGLVLWHFDGERWHHMRDEPGALALLEPEGLVEYEMVIEPHRGNHIYTLDIPAEAPNRSLFTASRVIYIAGTGRRMEQVRLKSYLRAKTGPLLAWERAGLRLPENGNPRSVALAREWREMYASPREVVDAALAMFHTEPFRYTLSPPVLYGDHVDTFLFITRSGFCEHYAAAFTFLMRAAGIPARIVVGYQGGEFNPVGGYLTVRQSDAHAWSEVWLEGQGWTRVDPTAAVAPERIEMGAGQFFEQETESWWDQVVFKEGSFLERGRYLFENINYIWTKGVVEHTYGRQRRFLDWLGMRFGSGLAVLLLVGGLVLAALAALLPLFWRSWRAKHREPAERLYQSFCLRYARAGQPRENWQGPVEYAQVLSERFPQDVDSIWRFISRYIRIRYGRMEEDQLRAELAELKRNLHS